ncbi:MAG: hypothetical protein WDN06_09305 [Asticcacaulis sp.]
MYGGIKAAAEQFGGSATLSPDGSFTQRPDVAVVVIGEDPYAEFQGDRTNLAYKQGDTSDLDLIDKLKAQGIPVVTVFCRDGRCGPTPTLTPRTASSRRGCPAPRVAASPTCWSVMPTSRRATISTAS